MPSRGASSSDYPVELLRVENPIHPDRVVIKFVLRH
jgi:hypothetical protein